MRSQRKTFESKFGESFLNSLPSGPGVYLIFSTSAELIYIGKSKNLKRRLSQYRNAKRRKKHFKMRSIIEDAQSIEIQATPSELDALLLEAKLIQKHRPRWNVAGAFSFLYPMIGIKQDQSGSYFCYTTQPSLYPEFRFHGAYRSRETTREAFKCLMELLEFIGHPIEWKKLKSQKRDRYSIMAGFRTLPIEWIELLGDFCSGKSNLAMELLVLGLVENASARRKSKWVQAQLRVIKKFWIHEASLIERVVKTLACQYPIAQCDRDELLLKFRFGARNSDARNSQILI